MLRISMQTSKRQHLIGLVRAGTLRELTLIDVNTQQPKLNCAKQPNVLLFLIKLNSKLIAAAKENEEKN